MTYLDLESATAAMIAETTLPSVPAAPATAVPSLKCLHCKDRYAGLHKRGLCCTCYKEARIRINYPPHRHAWQDDQILAREQRQDAKRTKRQRACKAGELPCGICEVPVKVPSEIYEARVRLRFLWWTCQACEERASEK